MKTITHDAQKFFDLRDLIQNVSSYQEACEKFKWPRLTKFNWATDFFDVIAEGNNKLALIYADNEGHNIEVSYDTMMRRSNQVANLFSDMGLQKGDRVLIMMETSVELFEIFLGLMKLGASMIPASTLLSPADISDRIERGEVKFVVVHNKFRMQVDQAGDALKHLQGLVCVRQIAKKCDCEEQENIPCWTDFQESFDFPEEYEPSVITYTTDHMFLFFTSGTTSKPKLVMHNYHYPIGHLTTMYWLDLQPDDVHYNISSPGWAKFVWSSLFAPWNAGATAFVYNYSAFDAEKTMKLIEKHKVTSLCAPLSVWKLFLMHNANDYKFNLKKIVSAGEPLNPEITRKVKEFTGLNLREGYGQTETTALIFTPKTMDKVAEGYMGKASPGYEVKILDDKLDEVPRGQDGQIAVAVYPVKPLGLLYGYDDTAKNREIFKGGWYLTGDTAVMDEEGFVHFIGRVDDVFKSLDYRISPFEVESEIMEYHAVMEVGVVPTIDAKDRIVPKAFVVLKPDYYANKQMALDLFRFTRDKMAPYKRPRSIEFMDEFPKTISSKIMRKDLKAYDKDLKAEGKIGKFEFFEKDFAKELNIRKRR